MYILAILFPLASAVANPTPSPLPKYMPNIEYFLRGYNVLKGNPHHTAVSTVDPGFQEPIFKLSYGIGTTTPDQKYFSPDGALVTICQSCSLSAGTWKISGMESYRDSLSSKVQGSAEVGLWPWWDYRFSWSVDWKRTESEIFKYKYLYTHSDASCCAYQVQTDLYKPPPFSSNFLRGIITLPNDYTSAADKALYKKFIESFGTNYIKQTDMGSLFGQVSEISQTSWSEMLQKSIKISESSSWSLFFATGYSGTSYANKKTEAEKFNSYTSSQTLYTKGSKPPTDGTVKSWLTEAKKYPAPIAFELGSLLDLFTHLMVSPQIITNMEKALKEYCDPSTNPACPSVFPTDKPFPTASG